jgi:hypothetical protein
VPFASASLRSSPSGFAGRIYGFKAAHEHWRIEKWCPGEDSNLHALASAST